MTRLWLTVALLMSAFSLNATQLSIVVRDVLDLASYGNVMQSSIELSTQKVAKNYVIDSWELCFSDCDSYSIALAVEVSPILSEIVDKPTYVVSVKKELRANGKTVATLMKKSFTLTEGQEKEETDVYWAEDLVVRQSNVFSLLP